MDYIHLAMTAFFYTVASLLVIAINEVKKQSHAVWLSRSYEYVMTLFFAYVITRRIFVRRRNPLRQ
jgi:hypothetical protein